MNVDGSQHKLIFGYNAGSSQIASRKRVKKAEYGNQQIIDFLEQDKNNILIVFYPWKLMGHVWRNSEDAKPVVYKLNVYSGDKQSVDYLPTPNADAITDNDGHLRFSIGENEDNALEIFYKKSDSDKWLPFQLNGFEGKSATPISFTSDNNSVYILANVGEGTRALYLLNLETQAIEKIYHNKDVNINEIIRDFKHKRVVAVATELGIPVYHYLDKKDAKARYQRILLKTFKGQDIVITSATKNGQFLVFFVYSDVNPGDYYLFDTRKLKAHFLVSKRPQLSQQKMASTEPFNFKTRDGQELYGYITAMKSSEKPLPMVVLPHGGPHGVRDNWGFDWEVQLLATQGYAVLQVNYRGSGGFGIKFQEDGYGKWGTLMQDDITDATKEMIKRGIADPKKICIYGSSYGGYAALMGVIREPDLYQCAIGSAGVYNLPMMFKEGDIATRKNGIAYLKDALGENLQDQKARSPVFNVDKIKAEILLIHGTKDERAPIEQVESLMKALKKTGKKFEWLKIPDEGHGYHDVNNRLIVYKRILKFLQKNIGGQR